MNVKLLKDKNFLLLMQGSFVSQIGSMMQTFALSLYVLKKYESATLFASILIVAVIPKLIIGPFAGVFVDWFDRKKIIVRFDLASGLVVGAAAILYYGVGELPLWAIYALSIALSLIATLFRPAIQTVIPTIMKEKDLVDANAINSIVFTTSSLIAPLLGGVLMSFSVIGVVLVMNAASFFISAFTEMFITIPERHKTPDEIGLQSFKIDFLEGVHFIRDTKFVLMIGIIACSLNIAISPVFSVALPFILKKIMMVQDYEFGILNAAVATASILAGFIAAGIIRKLSVNRILMIDFLAQPLLVGALTLITSQWFLLRMEGYFAPLILLGIVQYLLVMIMTIGNIAIHTSFQKLIPNELLGRVGTVMGTFAMGSIPLGQAFYGFMLERYAPWVPLCCSVALLFVVVWKSYVTLTESDLLSKQKSVSLDENRA